MIEALERLIKDKHSCCAFYPIITGAIEDQEQDTSLSELSESRAGDMSGSFHVDESLGLNESQIEAVHSSDASLSLIWGPPGRLVINIAHSLAQSPYRHGKNHCRCPNPEEVSHR
jgi:hypothetical protein